MQLCGCRAGSDSSRPAARWIYRDGVSGTLCSPHLDMWLDNADDDPVMEPSELVWL